MLPPYYQSSLIPSLNRLWNICCWMFKLFDQNIFILHQAWRLAMPLFQFITNSWPCANKVFKNAQNEYIKSARLQLDHDQLKLRKCFLPWVSKNRRCRILKGIDRLCDFFFILLNLEAWNLAGVYKIENK